MRGFLLALVALALMAGAAQSATGDRLDRSRLVQAFSAEFNDTPATPLSIWSKDNPRGTWKTNYYFGNQTWRATRPLTMAEQFGSRALPAERQVYVDPAYCGQNPFWIGNGRLYIYALKASAYVQKTCGQGSKDFISGLITTEKSWSQVYGFFEISALLPSADGAWPAFWLLPTDPSAPGGNRPEIDVLEHYAGDSPTIFVSKGVPLNRTGLANITVHLPDQSSLAPKPQPATTATLAFHSYGVLWTPTELIFYLDDRETWRTPFVYDKPMYLLVNLAVSDKTAGDPAQGRYPASLVIDYVRTSSLR